MTAEPQHLVADCRRIADILARVGDKWTILLLMAIGDRRMRFGELHRAINGISQRMLTVTLRNLEHDGILIRTVYPRFRRASNTSSPTVDARSSLRSPRSVSG